MAGTITQTWNTIGHIQRVRFACTADAAAATFPDTELSTRIEGTLLDLKTVPGDTAPTNLYDITLEDADGLDVLQGVGADRSSASAEKVPVVYSGTGTHPHVDEGDVLTLKIANNSQNSAELTIDLYFAVGQ